MLRRKPQRKRSFFKIRAVALVRANDKPSQFGRRLARQSKSIKKAVEALASIDPADRHRYHTARIERECNLDLCALIKIANVDDVREDEDLSRSNSVLRQIFFGEPRTSNECM